MFGLNIIMTCPFCGETCETDISAITSYDYENREVIIRKHCGKEFITELNIYDENKIRQRYSGYGMHWYDAIKNIAKTIDKSLSEEYITNEIITKLKESYEETIINKEINDIKTVIELVLANNNKYWSVPLTSDMKLNQLKKSRTCLY